MSHSKKLFSILATEERRLYMVIDAMGIKEMGVIVLFWIGYKVGVKEGD